MNLEARLSVPIGAKNLTEASSALFSVRNKLNKYLMTFNEISSDATIETILGISDVSNQFVVPNYKRSVLTAGYYIDFLSPLLKDSQLKALASEAISFGLEEMGTNYLQKITSTGFIAERVFGTLGFVLSPHSTGRARDQVFSQALSVYVTTLVLNPDVLINMVDN